VSKIIFLLCAAMETVVSGIRPTGNLHLGNYFGALVNFVKMQNDYNCFFFIADYHSLTTHRIQLICMLGSAGGCRIPGLRH